MPPDAQSPAREDPFRGAPLRPTRDAPARDDLCRSKPFELVRADDDGSDGLTLEGYGAVFDSPTQIDSWEGSFEEVLARGCFRKSLNERTPRMQFDHGYHPLIGSIPIGRITEIGEDQRGLHLVGRLSGNWLIEPVRDAIADGSVDGMSFRFSVVREEWRDKDGKPVKPDELWELLWNTGDRGPLKRTLKEVKVTEVGPVVWPAYENTTVDVRSKVTIDMARIGEPDQRSALARAVFLADAATRTTEPAAPETALSEPPDAPRSTEPAPTGHPSDDAPATAGTPGEHPSARPANPTERRRVIRAEYRQRLERVLALPQSSKRTGAASDG
ncbi:MAG: HK97 family phage prohead protease [Actinomycetota bacterium]|nr:HK97 family phage prohead protease [Actinomycetota bacterium]